MRLAAQAKAGYYPTPLPVVRLLREMVQFPSVPFAALDPCCGTGEALQEFLAGSQGQGYGIELDLKRASEARKRLHRVIASPFECCQVSQNAFSVLWLNPPYDQEADTAPDRKLLRQEYTFLTASTRLLTTGGLVVYIVPQHLLADRHVAEYLAARYTGLRVGAFPAELNGFRQVVVLGTKISGQATRRGEVRDWLRGLAHTALPELPATVGQENAPERYTVPQTPPDVQVFLSMRPSPEDLYAEAARSELWREIRQRTEVQPVGVVRDRPPMTLRAGHLPLLVAGGAFNGVVGEGPEQHLAKGTVRYETVTTEEELGEGRVEVRETRIPKVCVAILTGNGEIRRLT